MRDQSKSSTAPARRTLENAFTAGFLDAHRGRARRLSEDPPSTPSPVRELRTCALFAGPWEVERIEPEDRTEGALYAVVRRGEPIADGGGAVAVLKDRATALLVAAALSALACPCALSVNRERQAARRRRHGLPLHDGRTFLGHLTPQLCLDETGEEAGLLPFLHALRTLAASPDALSLLVEALEPEVLPILGRALMRRVR